MPGFKYPGYFSALIEQESCIYLTHKQCWSPTSRLKTKREEGAGLGQITRAYRPDGTLRFDSLSALRIKHEQYLKDFTWETVYRRPDLQVRGILLLWRDNYKRLNSIIPSEYSKVAMSSAAYNGGIRGIHQDRLLCGLKKNCDPKKWFNNVEKTCSKSKKILYGDRSACDINRHYVSAILHERYNKYGNYFKLKHTKNNK